ncbi:MAG: hypothetical protein ACQEP7_03835 [bacterium]
MSNKMRIFSILVVGAICINLFLIGCGGSETLSGKWLCVEHVSEAMVGKISLEFRSDGTFTMSPMGGDGTYKIKGGTVILTNKLFENGLELKKEGNRLIAASEIGDIVYEKQ